MRRYMLRHGVTILLAAAGIVFLLLGVYRAEAETVLKKATRICLECIGIG